MTVQTMRTDDEARALVDHLLAPGRTRPVCLVSVAEGETTPYIDMEEVAAALGDGFDYVLIPTGRLTFILEDRLPRGANAYGGAARVYPVGDGWQKDPYAYPLVLCQSRQDGAEATQRLIRDGQRHGTTRVESPPLSPQQVAATVRRLVPPTRALAVTQAGDQVVVDSERVLRGLRIDQLVEEDQAVEGVLAEDRQLVLVLPPLDLRTLEGYAVGTVVLGRVAEVHADRAVVELVPRVTAVLMRDDVTGNHVDRLSTLLAKGQVVAARVVRVGQPGGKPWKLQMSDVDDDEPVAPAPPLLPGGPPWLTPEMVTALGEPAPEEEVGAPPDDGPMPVPAPKPRPATPPSAVPGPPRGTGPDPAGERTAYPQVVPQEPTEQGPEDVPGHGLELRMAELERLVGQLQRTVATLEHGQAGLTRRVAAVSEQGSGAGFVSELVRRERDDARAQVQSLQEELRRLEEHRDRLTQDLAAARKEARRAARQLARQGPPAAPAFLDEEEELRWQVHRTWVERIPAAEKAELPLGEYVVLPGFLESLRTTPGVDLAKVAGVVVDIATGRVHSLAGHQTHQLRESESSDRHLTREDGATCWRVSLQVKSPSARRLHYWQPPSGRPPELSSVRLHDDLRP